MSDRLRSITRLVTRDVFDCLKNAKLARTRRKLPGRKMVYLWGDHIKRDPFNDADIPGFIVRLEILDRPGESPSIDAEAGEEDGDVVVWIRIYTDIRDASKREKLYYELRGVIRHELEHLSAIGPLTMMGPLQNEVYGDDMPTSGKLLHDINRRKKVFDTSMQPKESWACIEKSRSTQATLGDFLSYVTSYDELGPFVVGFMTQAKASRVDFKEVATDYLDSFVSMKRISENQKEEIMTWLMIWVLERFPRYKLRQRPP